METRPFGNTGMNITTIGFGAWAIGGGNWRYGWGPQDDEESIKTIHAALDAGMNWIDTAPAYGLGRSEEVVAKALEGMSDRPYVFTKCGLVWDENDETGDVDTVLKAESIRREVEDSLRRLRVETIDLYQIHWNSPDEDIEEGWATLVELKKEGKLQHIGVSNFNVSEMERCNKYGPVETLQPPYSLVNRAVGEEILPYCKENNIGVIVYSPMQSGLLTGKMTRERIENLPDNDWRKRDDEFKEPNLTKNLAMVDKLAEIGERHGRSIPEMAVAWTLKNPAVTAAIVGARRPDQIDGYIGAADFRLSDEEMTEIADFVNNL